MSIIQALKKVTYQYNLTIHQIPSLVPSLFIIKSFIVYVWKLGNITHSKIMQTCLPADYIPHQNRYPQIIFKLFFHYVHLPFSLNKPSLQPSIWEINNFITLHKIFAQLVGSEAHMYILSLIFFQGHETYINFHCLFNVLPYIYNQIYHRYKKNRSISSII